MVLKAPSGNKTVVHDMEHRRSQSAGQGTASKVNNKSIDAIRLNPYFLDLTSCVSSLFPKVRKKVRGRAFSNEEIINTIKVKIQKYQKDDIKIFEIRKGN